MLDQTLYTIQAYVTGLGWLTFDTTRDPLDVESKEHAASLANSRYPGTAPRRTRILADGVPVPAKPNPLTALLD
jgi:hypothetical protein